MYKILELFHLLGLTTERGRVSAGVGQRKGAWESKRRAMEGAVFLYGIRGFGVGGEFCRWVGILLVIMPFSRCHIYFSSLPFLSSCHPHVALTPPVSLLPTASSRFTNPQPSQQISQLSVFYLSFQDCSLPSRPVCSGEDLFSILRGEKEGKYGVKFRYSRTAAIVNFILI